MATSKYSIGIAGTLVERRPGSPYPASPLRFLKQDTPKNPDTLFSMELPAQIIRCDDIYAGGITPIGRIVIDGQHPAPAACVSASVVDEDAVSKAAFDLQTQLGDGPMAAAALRISSTTKSFTEVAEMANHLGCGCGGAGRMTGTLSLGASMQEGGALSWSKAVPAALVVKSAYDDFSGDVVANTTGFILASCNSDWYWKGFFRKRITLCEGVCKGSGKGKPCTCDSSAPNAPRLCQGWVSCDC
ncbi:hypothetical protein [Pelagibius sp. Alg239-R121]|uniref:hypothetical protein n=1 Tax=Pelagibius sp. Alg239-R121 TaxID=2993448 RepID=UPI0024A64194|nr:hypothetical protein [Pelagibius sp. Alg239-R121]